MSERYFSVDVETAGPIVSMHSLLSIGVVCCDELSRTFSRNVIPISEAADDRAMQVVGKPLSFFHENGEAARDVFLALRTWLAENDAGSIPVFVGFNAAFDWGFVNWYFLTYLGANPFGFAPLDIKAYYAGFAGTSWEETRSSNIPDQFKGNAPHTHIALDDAIEQAEMFNKIRTAAQTRE